jgi:hypothetical protein
MENRDEKGKVNGGVKRMNMGGEGSIFSMSIFFTARTARTVLNFLDMIQ